MVRAQYVQTIHKDNLMKLTASLLLLSLTACRSTGELTLETDGEADVEAGEAGSGDEESANGGSGWNGRASVKRGPWNAVGASIDGDPCGWSAYFAEYGYYTIEAFLPRAFDVESFEGGFEIEATNYGAKGPIVCSFEGSEFSCETQQVKPGFDDWLYTIDFAGEVSDEQTMTGTAVVSFVVDADTEAQMKSAGLSPDECDHTVDLELAWGSW